MGRVGSKISSSGQLSKRRKKIIFTKTLKKADQNVCLYGQNGIKTR